MKRWLTYSVLFSVSVVLLLQIYRFRDQPPRSTLRNVASREIVTFELATHLTEPFIISEIPRISSFNPSKYGEMTWKRRKQRLNEACALTKNNDTNKGTKKMRTSAERPALYYSDHNKFLVCAIPKCGSSQWRNLILILENIIDAYSADDVLTGNAWMLARRHRSLWNAFDVRTTHGRREVQSRLDKYFKIMTVREPLERLVSAYKNKLEEDHDRHFVALSKRIHKQYGNGTEGYATFDEFVDMILLSTDPQNLNRHWRPYSDLCDPCNVNYDYILKMETIDRDITYVTEKLGIERNKIFNSSKIESLQRKWKSDYPAYFKQISPAKRKAIFEYYKSEYDAFGYPYPDLSV